MKIRQVKGNNPYVLDWIDCNSLSAERWLWSDLADAHADLSLRSAHTHFVLFVISWLKRNPCLYGT